MREKSKVGKRIPRAGALGFGYSGALNWQAPSLSSVLMTTSGRFIKADIFSHCQPQSNYLYRSSVSVKNDVSAIGPSPLPHFGGLTVLQRHLHEESGAGRSRSRKSGGNNAAAATWDRGWRGWKPSSPRPTAVPTPTPTGDNLGFRQWDVAWKRGDAVCDYLIGDPAAHTQLLRQVCVLLKGPSRLF